MMDEAGSKSDASESEITKDTVRKAMMEMQKNLQANPTEGVNAVIQYHLVGQSVEDWRVILNGKHCVVEPGTVENPDATFTAEAQDFIRLMNGQMEEVGWSFMQGRLIVSGDMSVLWKILAQSRAR
jgi:putative sterol carrier protein